MMSVSGKARASKIDNTPSEIKRDFTNAVSSLSSAVDRAKAFAAFMHSNPHLEFEQVDLDKYSSMFIESFNSLNTVLAQLQELKDLHDRVITPEQFVASYGLDVAEYSKRFD